MILVNVKTKITFMSSCFASKSSKTLQEQQMKWLHFLLITLLKQNSHSKGSEGLLIVATKFSVLVSTQAFFNARFGRITHKKTRRAGELPLMAKIKVLVRWLKVVKGSLAERVRPDHLSSGSHQFSGFSVILSAELRCKKNVCSESLSEQPAAICLRPFETDARCRGVTETARGTTGKK